MTQRLGGRSEVSGYVGFLGSLLDHGRIRLESPLPVSATERRRGDDLLIEMERQYRDEMPLLAPPYDPAAGQAAARALFRAAQLMVYRELEPAKYREELAVPHLAWDRASTHYSVDLVMRFLPDISRRAHAMAENDSLLPWLESWARRCPLSSVGVPNVGEVDIDVLAGNRALMQLYVDRIIATEDISRLGDRRVRGWVRAALGPVEEVAVALRGALETMEGTEYA